MPVLVKSELILVNMSHTTIVKGIFFRGCQKVRKLQTILQLLNFRFKTYIKITIKLIFFSNHQNSSQNIIAQKVTTLTLKSFFFFFK